MLPFKKKSLFHYFFSKTLLMIALDTVGGPSNPHV